MAEQLALIDLPPQPPEWDEREVFYSRPEYIWPLVQYLKNRILNGPFVVEPCVGGGALVDGLSMYGHRDDYILTGDVRDVAADWVGDWTGSASEWRYKRDVRRHLKRAGMVISNPPFTEALPIIEASWRHCPNALVAMLLPWRWYEHTKERGPWLRKHNPDLVNIGRCEFFRPDGTSAGDGDSTTYAWVIFGPDRKGLLGGHHELLPWKEAPNATVRKDA